MVLFASVPLILIATVGLWRVKSKRTLSRLGQYFSFWQCCHPQLT